MTLGELLILHLLPMQNEKKILYELFYGLTRVVFPKSFPIAVTKELGKSQSREKGVILV